MDASFLSERITRTKAMIEEIEDALIVLGPNSTTLSYSLDTGQGKQSVTRQDLPRLQTMLESLYNRLDTLCARQNGSGVLVLRPGF